MMRFLAEFWAYIRAGRKFWLLPLAGGDAGGGRAAGAGADLGDRALHLLDLLGPSCVFSESPRSTTTAPPRWSRTADIVAAAQEERFSRIRHDAAFPHESVRFCLRHAGIKPEQLDAVAFYEKPFLKFERILETWLAFAPRGFQSFRLAAPVWLREKLFQRAVLERALREHSRDVDWGARLLFSEHHMSHAASAFYPSPFEEAAILTIDGVGEWTTTSIGVGRGKCHPAAGRNPLPAFPGTAVFGVHVLHRLSRQLRRIQADGAGALRRLPAIARSFWIA